MRVADDQPSEKTLIAMRCNPNGVIPRERRRGIQYAAASRFITIALDYWITRFRG
jgi:hypothetical protein